MSQKCKAFKITGFTCGQKSELLAGQDGFCFSSGSLGVCCSQKKNINRVIQRKRTSKKQQLKYNFTWISQKCEHQLLSKISNPSRSQFGLQHYRKLSLKLFFVHPGTPLHFYWRRLKVEWVLNSRSNFEMFCIIFFIVIINNRIQVITYQSRLFTVQQ